MNNRIRLMAKAHEAFAESRVTAPEVTKFMELIVQECLTVINDSKEYKTPKDGWSEWDAGWNPALEQAEENIKQHFGVNDETI